MMKSTRIYRVRDSHGAIRASCTGQSEEAMIRQAMELGKRQPEHVFRVYKKRGNGREEMIYATR